MKVLLLISIVNPVTGQGVKAAQYKGCRLFRENLDAGETANLITKPQISPRRHEDHEEEQKRKLVKLTYWVAVNFECEDVDFRWSGSSEVGAGQKSMFCRSLRKPLFVFLHDLRDLRVFVVSLV
jgi:hypothetical protein